MQSRIFFAKFLLTNNYKKIKLSDKFLIDEIYRKVCTNLPLFNMSIDFDRVNNSGIINNKPIYVIYPEADENKLKSQIFALYEVYKRIQFRTLFMLDGNKDEMICRYIDKNTNDLNYKFDYKFISLKDINLKLLQEINKLNLNFDVVDKTSVKDAEDFQCEELKPASDIFKNGRQEMQFEDNDLAIKVTKFLNFDDLLNFSDSRVCYLANLYNNSDKNKEIKFNVLFKLKDQFFNVKDQKSQFVIEYYSKKTGKDYFYFSNSLFNFEFIKINEVSYVRFNFKVLVNSHSNNQFIVISSNVECESKLGKIDILKLIFQNHINLEKIFNLNIYTKNPIFNDFFNKKLKNLIILEKLNENKMIENKIIDKNKLNENKLRENGLSDRNKLLLNFSKYFNISYKDLASVLSYFQLYNLFVKDVFGIKMKNDLIEINPVHFRENFKVVIRNPYKNDDCHNILVCQNSDNIGLEIGGVLYSNLKTIDLSLLKEKNIKLSI
jgi:hypothetical protein